MTRIDAPQLSSIGTTPTEPPGGRTDLDLVTLVTHWQALARVQGEPL